MLSNAHTQKQRTPPKMLQSMCSNDHHTSNNNQRACHNNKHNTHKNRMPNYCANACDSSLLCSAAAVAVAAAVRKSYHISHFLGCHRGVAQRRDTERHTHDGECVCVSPRAACECCADPSPHCRETEICLECICNVRACSRSSAQSPNMTSESSLNRAARRSCEISPAGFISRITGTLLRLQPAISSPARGSSYRKQEAKYASEMAMPDGLWQQQQHGQERESLLNNERLAPPREVYSTNLRNSIL